MAMTLDSCFQAVLVGQTDSQGTAAAASWLFGQSAQTADCRNRNAVSLVSH